MSARVRGEQGPIRAALPLRIGLRRGGVSQAVYTNTRDGDMPGVVPFLKSFGAQPIEVAVTDIVSGKSAVGSTG